MRKNGFTLIELLAVIVILAIIALIATPIILGIINDAREESNERSVELYAAAVRNGIAAYQLTNGEVPAGTYSLTADKTSLTNGTVTFDVDYDGNVVCTSIIISDDSKVSLSGCKVNGGEKVYGYGTEEDETPNSGSTPPNYYSWDLFSVVGWEAPATPSPEPPTGKNFYNGYDVTDGIISASYACFVREGTQYCLKGEPQDEKKLETFEANKTILVEVFGESACNVRNDSVTCNADGLTVSASSNGNLDAGGVIDGDFFTCSVNGSGAFHCELI